MFALELSMKKVIKKNWGAGFLVIPAIIAFGFSRNPQNYFYQCTKFENAASVIHCLQKSCLLCTTMPNGFNLGARYQSQ
jgi:hypothetical protein